MNDCLLILFMDHPTENSGSLTAEHLYDTTSLLPYDKLVLYPDSISSSDLFSDGTYAKELQSGGDTGSRLSDAFSIGFERGYRRVVLVRSGTLEMGQGHVVEAFERLKEGAVVIGPGENGGYYLMGLGKLIPELFRSKDWNGEDVFLDTLIDLKTAGLEFALLDTLPCDSGLTVSSGLSRSKM